MKPSLFACAFGLVSAMPLSAHAGAQSSSAGAVRAAQVIYREVETAIQQHRVARRDTSVRCPDNGLDAHASIFADRNHRIRRLDTDGGTEDHAERLHTYFDTLGRARFSFAQRGAVNGTQQLRFAPDTVVPARPFRIKVIRYQF